MLRGISGCFCADGKVGDEQAKRGDAHFQLARTDAGEPGGITTAKLAELVLVSHEAGVAQPQVDGFVGDIFHLVFTRKGGGDAK